MLSVVLSCGVVLMIWAFNSRRRRRLRRLKTRFEEFLFCWIVLCVFYLWFVFWVVFFCVRCCCCNIWWWCFCVLWRWKWRRWFCCRWRFESECEIFGGEWVFWVCWWVDVWCCMFCCGVWLLLMDWLVFDWLRCLSVWDRFGGISWWRILSRRIRENAILCCWSNLWWFWLKVCCIWLRYVFWKGMLCWWIFYVVGL